MEFDYNEFDKLGVPKYEDWQSSFDQNNADDIVRTTPTQQAGQKPAQGIIRPVRQYADGRLVQNTPIKQQRPRQTTAIKTQSPQFSREIASDMVLFVFFGRITGMIALIFTLISENAYQQGDIPRYQDYQNKARITRIIGYVFAGLIIILMLALMLFMVTMS